MAKEIVLSALESGKVLELRYDGSNRLVEVHAVGLSKKAILCIRVYQVSGGSVSGETEGWKLMLIDKSFSAHLTDIPSQAPRSGYSKGDKSMTQIFAEI
ncbi:hypothetical protein [Xanthomonas euvesicatoria]|uniref:hypothetical protein n=1 Tax=Xanthomonas euvesicatoria TaxID=456327 RepID=UPI001C486108|nr:hypothetical protein [Xanthomonas euvesicatoria]MBV6884180.1 hypothetical protein [Xanthomonas campestris pv. euphorbiae]